MMDDAIDLSIFRGRTERDRTRDYRAGRRGAVALHPAIQAALGPKQTRPGAATGLRLARSSWRAGSQRDAPIPLGVGGAGAAGTVPWRAAGESHRRAVGPLAGEPAALAARRTAHVTAEGGAHERPCATCWPASLDRAAVELSGPRQATNGAQADRGRAPIRRKRVQGAISWAERPDDDLSGGSWAPAARRIGRDERGRYYFAASLREPRALQRVRSRSSTRRGRQRIETG